MRMLVLKCFSVIGALLVGLWLPLHLIGFSLPPALDIAIECLIFFVAVVDVILADNLASRMIDGACILPLVLLSGLSGAPWLAAVNFVLVRHVLSVKSVLDDIGALRPMVYRLVPLVVLLPLLVHFSACGWIALGSGSAGNDGTDFFRYVRAFYWSFTTLTTVGYGDIVAVTPGQMMFACTIQLVGVGVFGFILSNIAALISRADAAREHHMDNLDKIETFMRSHAIPETLSEKVRGYYHYLWRHKKGYSDRSLLDGLPAKIQSELFVAINRAIIEKVPLFRDASTEMIEELMNQLEPRVFVPAERIFKIDDPGDALYFIQDGAVEIVGRDGSVIVVLREGAFFGEMALTSSQLRNASARAIGFCDVFMLHKSAFDTVLASYPSFREHIEELVAQRSA